MLFRSELLVIHLMYRQDSKIKRILFHQIPILRNRMHLHTEFQPRLYRDPFAINMPKLLYFCKIPRVIHIRKQFFPTVCNGMSAVPVLFDSIIHVIRKTNLFIFIAMASFMTCGFIYVDLDDYGKGSGKHQEVPWLCQYGMRRRQRDCPEPRAGIFGTPPFYTRYLFPCSLPAVLIISKRLFLKTPSASSNNGINFPRINVSSAARARK